jgi:hypothetical protein
LKVECQIELLLCITYSKFEQLWLVALLRFRKNSGNKQPFNVEEDILLNGRSMDSGWGSAGWVQSWTKLRFFLDSDPRAAACMAQIPASYQSFAELNVFSKRAFPDWRGDALAEEGRSITRIDGVYASLEGVFILCDRAQGSAGTGRPVWHSESASSSKLHFSK